MPMISAQELVDWIEGEGGIYSLMRHGIDIDDIENDELRSAMNALDNAFYKFEEAWQDVRNVLSDLGVEY